ncbi:MAG: universal stress protein [Paracoccaceae bacterium]|nr:universal stress protein [Paracoccaceae bacterium]
MTQHILIPVALDHEGLVEKKIAVARRLLAPGGKITLLTVLENVPGFVAEFVTVDSPNHLTQVVKGKLDTVAGGAADVATEIVTGKAGVEIVRYARENGADLIIIGSHEPGIEDYFLGSTASRVARRAPCAVYILR